MPHTIGWGDSPTPYPSQRNMGHDGNTVPFLLGQLVAQGAHTVETLREIKDQLSDGHARMNGMDGRLLVLEQHRTAQTPPIPPPPGQDGPSRLERVLVRWGAWLMPILVAWGTGSIDKGMELAKLMASMAVR